MFAFLRGRVLGVAYPFVARPLVGCDAFLELQADSSGDAFRELPRLLFSGGQGVVAVVTDVCVLPCFPFLLLGSSFSAQFSFPPKHGAPNLPPSLLPRILRKPRPAAIRETVATLIGLLVRHATYIAPGAGRAPARQHSAGGSSRSSSSSRGSAVGPYRTGTEETEGLMTALIATVAERPTPGRSAQAAAAALRRNTLAALGELLFYVVTQEPPTAAAAAAVVRGRSSSDGGDGGNDAETWSIPVAEVGGVVEKCLLVASATAGGGPGVQHYAAKTLENVLAQVGPSHPLVSVLVTPELGVGLLHLAR